VLYDSKVSEEEGLLDDDVLGVVDEDGVPREVREWLAITFTRTPTSNVPKPLTADDKQLKFRSVAHAIRAGIVVDRLPPSPTPLSLFSQASAVLSIVYISVAVNYLDDLFEQLGYGQIPLNRLHEIAIRYDKRVERGLKSRRCDQLS